MRLTRLPLVASLLIAHAGQKFDEQLRLTDEKAKELVYRSLEALRDLTLQLHK